MNEKQINQQVADQICETSRWNGKKFQRGQWVALLDGSVVAVGADLAVVLRALRTLDPDPTRGMIVEVRPPVIDAIR